MAKNMQNKVVNILYGLPGSGKSTFASENTEQLISKYVVSNVIDVDSIAKESYDKDKITNRILEQVGQIFLVKGNTHLIIDGLFTTNAQVRTLMDRIINKFQDYNITFKLDWWEEDRAACIWNDKGRREQNSMFSIENLPFEVPDTKLFPELIYSRIRKHQVVRRSDAKNWALEHGCFKRHVNDGILKSDSWCLGGTWGHYDGEGGTKEADQQPDFEAFETLIETTCPEISYLAYKKIVIECCKVVTVPDSDYYGGSWADAHHECDLEKLYSILKEKGYIKEQS